MNIEVNFLAVLAAAIVSMGIGFAWYSPMLFGKQWMKLRGYTAESMKSAQKEMGKLYGISFVASLVTAYVLTHVMVMSQSYFQNDSLTTGLLTTFWSWIGFVLPTQLTSTIFGDKKWNLLAIDTGYQLAALLAMGVVIGLMGL